jgi:hypothetical protein
MHQLAQVPLRVDVFAAVGLFAYHLFYFSALRLATPAQAEVIAYMWPLLIVVFSILLSSERLRAGVWRGRDDQLGSRCRAECGVCDRLYASLINSIT